MRMTDGTKRQWTFTEHKRKKCPMVKFDAEKTIHYWMEGAQYDMDVAKALYEKQKYPYALFMGHLALEKLLKALVVKTTQQHAPYTHSLTHLAEKMAIRIPRNMMKKL